MSSPAAVNYMTLSECASVILKFDRTTLDRREVQIFYGASFVAQVAAWNSYITGLVQCFFSEVADPTIPTFHAMHTLAWDAAEKQITRFNTPNAENTRNLILACTGYDPWPDWCWPARSLRPLDARLRLNEILKVRHSLAHGFTMPGYVWNQMASGEARLNLGILEWTRAFFHNLVKSTDTGLKKHLAMLYGMTPAW